MMNRRREVKSLGGRELAAGLACVLWLAPSLAQSLPQAVTQTVAHPVAQTAVRTAPQPASTEYFLHPVAAGDTLIELQQRLLQPGHSWQSLQKLNAVADPRRLMPGSTLRIPLAWLRQDSLVAVVLYVNGEVTVERAGSAARRLVEGDSLLEGDTLQTGPQSSASFKLGDGSRVLLRPDSRLVVERSRVLGDPKAPHHAIDHRLLLQSGSADTRTAPAKPGVKTRLDMVTPVVNLGVRGTEFRTQSGSSSAKVEVLAGAVAAGPQAVAAGFGATAVPGQVNAPKPLLPPPQLDGVSRLVDRLPLRLAWAALPGAKGFRAQVLASPAETATAAAPALQPQAATSTQAEPGERLLLEGLFDQAQAQWPNDLPDGRYLLRVRGADEAGLEGRDATVGFVLKARPQPPFLTQPAAGANLVGGSVAFGWTQSASASRYRLQVAAQPDFAAPLLDRSDIEGARFTWEAEQLGTFYWRVASTRANGDQGPWSDAQPFTRSPSPPPPPPSLPATPQLQAPDASGSGLMLRWRGDAGNSWRVQVSRDPAFATLLVDEKVDQAQWLLEKPKPGTYYMRVAAVAANGQGSGFGDVQTFEVPATPWSWWWLLPALLLLLPL